MEEKLQALLKKYQRKLSEIEDDLGRDIESDEYERLSSERDATEGFITELNKILGGNNDLNF